MCSREKGLFELQVVICQFELMLSTMYLIIKEGEDHLW